jgi:UDP-N-acetyl-D-mannosaminuronic acid transferase (WecB/TagA/CpsF family)
MLVNSSLLYKGTKDSLLDEALQKADILIPNGKLIQKSLMWLYKSDSERFSAGVLLDSIIKELDLRSFFFLGAEKVFDKLSVKYPGVLIKRADERDIEALNSAISASRDRLFVVVCMPLGEQEKWIERSKGCVNACILGLGDLYYSQSFFKKCAYETSFAFRILRQKMVYS